MNTETKPQNLMEGLLSEMNRVREIIQEYNMIPAGRLAAMVMEQDIKNAEKAIVENDVIKMLTAYNSLKECQL